MEIWVLFILIGPLPGIVALLCGIGRIVADNRLEKQPVMTEGSIVAIKLIALGWRYTAYDLSVCYTVDGQEYTQDFRIDREEIIQYKEGDDVSVVYQQHDPQNALLEFQTPRKSGKKWILGALAWLAITVFVAVAQLIM